MDKIILFSIWFRKLSTEKKLEVINSINSFEMDTEMSKKRYRRKLGIGGGPAPKSKQCPNCGYRID
ncbi:hypothetical protein [Dendrosporobacter sp. 1207_IL3150]|uniref:hypothetical protein n=1 Tax=Dendrosporobacter sp. 1207_IL3150 TaxID=3084054 RepID=UPI002FDB1155